jgi:phthalate 4,5-cis-dihydrodiol dehydrogenase
VALSEALAGERAHYPDGRWAKATLELCLAILESHRQRREIFLSQQVASPW